MHHTTANWSITGHPSYNERYRANITFVVLYKNVLLTWASCLLYLPAKILKKACFDGPWSDCEWRRGKKGGRGEQQVAEKITESSWPRRAPWCCDWRYAWDHVRLLQCPSSPASFRVWGMQDGAPEKASATLLAWYWYRHCPLRKSVQNARETPRISLP